MFGWSWFGAGEDLCDGDAAREPDCPRADCGFAGAEVAVLEACRCPTPESDCWACPGISRHHGAHFAVAEIRRCCSQVEDPGAPALDEAGSGCKAHCCRCWLQKGLLVTIGHVGVDLCPPWLG